MASIHSTAQAIRVAMESAAAQGAWRLYDGPCLDALRSFLRSHLDRKHVRLCCSGTFAVELAIRSLHLEPDAEVLLAGYDFPGNLRAIQDAGATACLCDVAVDSWVPTLEHIEQAVGPKTRAIVISHLHGALAPMSNICEWAKRRGLFVVEDACQAHGAMVDGKPAGAWGDLSTFSYGGSKLIAASRGGAVVTDDPKFSQRMTIFCERGNDAFALSELQAAAIVPQYQCLPIDHFKRSEGAKELLARLGRFPWLRFAPTLAINQPAYYKFGLIVGDSILRPTRAQHFVQNTTEGSSGALMLSVRASVLARLKELQIDVGEGFRGFATRSANRCRQPVPLPNSRIASDSTLVLHHSHLLDPESGESTIEHVLEAFDTVDKEIAN